MKKILPFLLLLIVLVPACSLGPFAAVPTQTPEATQTDTVTPQPTATPVTPTQTFTLTPTLIGFKTATSTPLIVDTNTPTATLPPVIPSPLFIAPTVLMDGFIYVTVSLDEIYKAKGCEPSVVRVSAQVSSMNSVGYVLLFARFKSLKAERASKWTNIPMTPLGAGTFVYDLSSDQMLEDAYFETSWIEYQIVSTTVAGKEIGRTGIFKERLKMLQCVPTPSPTSANVKP